MSKIRVSSKQLNHFLFPYLMKINGRKRRRKMIRQHLMAFNKLALEARGISKHIEFKYIEL